MDVCIAKCLVIHKLAIVSDQRYGARNLPGRNLGGNGCVNSAQPVLQHAVFCKRQRRGRTGGKDKTGVEEQGGPGHGSGFRC